MSMGTRTKPGKALTGAGGGFDDVMANPLAHMTALAELDAPAPAPAPAAAAEPEEAAAPPEPILPARQLDSKTERQLEGKTESETARETVSEKASTKEKEGPAERRAARKEAVARARELGETEMKAVGLKMPEGLNDYLDDLQHRLKKRGVLKQDLLRHALQLLVIKVETGGDLGELD